MFDAGWLVPGNPPEYGGRNATLLEQFVHREELGRRRIYASFNPQGLSIIVPSILAFGTEEQKQPLGGADPAGRDHRRPRHERARRRLRPGRPAHPGRRSTATTSWSTARRCGPRAPTTPTSSSPSCAPTPTRPKHKGISVLLVPTDMPGPDPAAVRLDRRPRRPRLQRGVLRRRPGAGREPGRRAPRGLAGGHRLARPRAGDALAGLRRAARRPHRARRPGAARRRPRRRPARARPRSATLVIDATPCACSATAPWPRPAGAWRPTEQSILKLFGSEAVQAAHPRHPRGARPRRPRPHRAQRPAPTRCRSRRTPPAGSSCYLRSFAGTIAGGTSQIQRNIVAERVLGLPR